MILYESNELAKMMSSSVAPVFLIAGIAGVLSIMSLRYGRVIDRIRTLLREGPKLYKREISKSDEHLSKELHSLYKRAKLLRMTIILEVISIFCVTITILTLFASLSLGLDFRMVPIVFFMGALFFLIVGLILFIQDFALSLACIKHDMKVRADLEVSASGQESF